MPNEKGPSNSVISENEFNLKGKNYILAIANDAYPNDPLNNCIRDAEAFVETLVELYQFDNQNVTLLKNGNRKQILDAIKTQVNQVMPDDNLLIYYSGHGFYDESLDEGAWVPSGATFNDTDEFISNADLKVRLAAIHSHHTFLVVDSCYSGSLFLSGNTRGKGDNFLEKFPSRWGLASGRLQTVSDGDKGAHSPFAEAILFHLKNNDNSLSVMELCVRVIEQVGSNTNGQMPIGEPLQIAGHKAGQFVFHPKKIAKQETIIVPPKPIYTPTRNLSKEESDSTETSNVPFDSDKAMHYFTENNLTAIFSMLKEYAKVSNQQNVMTTAVLIEKQFNDLKRNEMMGVISYQEASLKRNQLNAALLDLINSL